MKDKREPLRFKGGPSRVLATMELAEGLPSSQACRVVLAEMGSLPLTVRPLSSKARTVSTLSFRLPKSTAPGSYKGSIEIGDQCIPIEVDVESRSSLRFIHPKFTHKGPPGAKASAELMLLNRGNVSVALPDKDTFCVFEDGGLARAFFRGLVEEDSDGPRRIDRILDELAKAHGGLVRVTINKGAGRLAPEEVRELQVDLHFSRKLIGGHTYRGTWCIADASLEVVIEVEKSAAGKRGTNAES
jgi:hypothetical protein